MAHSVLVKPGTNLPDVNWRLPYGRTDTGELSLSLCNGLPQLCPAAVGLVNLPPVDIQAFLLKLQQGLVPRRVGLPDFIPNHLKQITSLSPSRQPREEQTYKAQSAGQGEPATYLKLEEELITWEELVFRRATHREERKSARWPN